MNQNYSLAISFKLLNCLIFPTLSLLMMVSVSTIPIMQVFFLQVFIGAIISFIYLLSIKEKIPLKLSENDFLLYIGRALTNLGAMHLWIFALTTLGINEATALGYSGPLWVFLMARYMLKESFQGKILLLIIINIVGMFIILQPRFIDMPWQGASASLGAILLWSVYEVICKKQTSNQHYMLQSFYFMAISALIIFPFACNSWQSINLQEFAMLSLIALLSVTNITVIFIAYSLAPLMLLAPFSYSRLIFTVLLSSWLYNIIPSANSFIGAAIIMLGNGFFIYKLKNDQR